MKYLLTLIMIIILSSCALGRGGPRSKRVKKVKMSIKREWIKACTLSMLRKEQKLAASYKVCSGMYGR